MTEGRIFETSCRNIHSRLCHNNRRAQRLHTGTLSASINSKEQYPIMITPQMQILWNIESIFLNLLDNRMAETFARHVTVIGGILVICDDLTTIYVFACTIGQTVGHI